MISSTIQLEAASLQQHKSGMRHLGMKAAYAPNYDKNSIDGIEMIVFLREEMPRLRRRVTAVTVDFYACLRRRVPGLKG
ncbi:hypothetical protein C0J52_19268 [Blattella germanica]|nr:hypothetical protein C0J52_19268 [Blattella germanica]